MSNRKRAAAARATGARGTKRRKKIGEEESNENSDGAETKESSSDESDIEGLLKDCEHVSAFALDEVKAQILNPVNWHCKKCGTTEGIWVCLSCAHFGCGRFQQSHAIAHFTKTGHPLVLEINEMTVHCYMCMFYVLNDNKRGDVSILRGLLEQIQTQSFSPSVTRSGRVIHNGSQFTLRPQDHKQEDRICTAARHWKLYTLSKAFNKWKEHLHGQHRAESSSTHQASTKEGEVQEEGEEEEEERGYQQVEEKRKEKTDDAEDGQESESKEKEGGEQEMEMADESREEKVKGKGKEKEKEKVQPKKPPARSTRGRPRRNLAAELDLGSEFSRKNAITTVPQKAKTLIPGQTGLRNLGNTCFMNAILQALSNVMDFKKYFVLEFQPIDKRGKLWRRNTIDCLQQIQAHQASAKEISMSVELHNILRVVWSGKWAVVTPFALLDALWNFVPQFRNYQQQDAQEFLVFLLDRLHDELKLRNGGTKPKGNSDVHTIISQTFQGKLRSEVVCENCGNASPTFEHFLDLPLDIPVQHACPPPRGRKKAAPIPSCHIDECLRSFTQSEDLGECAYFCEPCNSKQNAHKTITIESLPNVLCIVLKRFCWTESSRAKIDTDVIFPLTGLDLSAYSTTNGQGDSIYDLKSVVCHHGQGLRSGHYTAFSFNHERKSWLHFNDSRVSVVTDEDVLAQQAYILFYEKQNKHN